MISKVKKVRAGALLLALFAAFAVASPAAATPPAAKITASAEVSCGTVVVAFTNGTKWAFSGDVRLDDQPGVDDAVSGLSIKTGPHKGKPFGPRYTVVALPAGETVTHTVTVPEDSGEHTVAWRVWRGPENDLYLDWESVKVASNCEPDPTTPAPTATVSPEPTSTATPDPADTGSPAPSTSPAAGASGGGQLALTGAPVWGLTAVGALLVLAGAAAMFRRRRRFEA